MPVDKVTARKALGGAFLSGEERCSPVCEQVRGCGQPTHSVLSGLRWQLQSLPPGQAVCTELALNCPGVGAEDTGWIKMF